ncbi:PH domain-containing protein [Labilibaculum sp. DW002]|uniref:PH domain-containing protein n=1 Tax=Paralabilibaculum antarcticum TaxID=2912572 RepID=A0ABT5VM99_9BACT|nr:PH domain-containing protein [Labilibaculum sp. DW002]MDE5416561.1 PH domain-containing protein [Labilibaculum sp. DW002]
MLVNEEFSNQVVLPDLLAPIEVQEFEDLEPKYKLVKQISSAIVLILALVGFFLFVNFSSGDIPIKVIIGVPFIFVVLFVLKLVFVILAFPKKGYLLREQDISYRSGLLIYKLTTIPFNRIQHVEVSQNIIEKSFGLSRVKVFTAGGSVSDLSIPGLLPDKAHQIESFLLSKVSKHE